MNNNNMPNIKIGVVAVSGESFRKQKKGFDRCL